MLRKKVLAGGFYLTARTLLGMGLSAAGSVVLLRVVELRELGLYAVVNLCIAFAINNLLDPGVSAHLIRKPENPSREELRTAFTILALITAALAGLVWATAGLIAGWYGTPEIAGLLRISSASLLAVLVSRISLAMLERELEYKKIAWVELTSSATYYGVSIAGALKGGGALALVVGDVCRYAVMAVMAIAVRRWPMGFHLDRQLARPILSYCAGFFSASTLSAANATALPLLAGKLLGLEPLALVRMVYGVVSQLTLVKSIALRIAGSAIARVQLQKEKVIGAVQEGAFYQLWVVGIPMVAVASQAEWLIPLVYGPKWAGAPTLLMLACLPPLVNTIFGMQSSALYAAGRPQDVARYSAIQMLAVWPLTAALLLKLGANGLPIAEIVALPLYWVMHRSFAAQFGGIDLRAHLLMAAGIYASGLLAAMAQPPWVSVSLYVSMCVLCFAAIGSARRKALELGRFLWRNQFASE